MNVTITLLSPEIPHNTGAVGRLCTGLGCSLHLIRPLGFVLTSRYIRRSGMDYWEHLDLHIHDNWECYLETCNPAAFSFASTRGKKSLYEHRFIPGEHIIFGSESSGLPDRFYTEYRDKLLRIPMPGKHARSINLANAVSIIAYEAFRQGDHEGEKEK